MSIELSQKFNQTVRRVEFFPFEWSPNLVAVCFADSVKIFTLIESTGPTTKKEDDGKKEVNYNSKLNLVSSVCFQQKVEHFSWSPKTYITNLKPIINFAVSDNSQNLIFCTASLTSLSSDLESINNVKTLTEKFEVDCIYGISFDHQNGELIAINADNFCFLWDLNEAKLRAKFALQSPGVNICWNRDEKNKLMVGEKSGTIRIFNLDTLKPVFSLMSYNESLKSMSFPLLVFDWSQTNPEFIVANTNTEIFLWNSAKSCLPEKTFENYEQLKCVRLCQFKENLIGFIDGHDACSKLTVFNFKTNQTIYQSTNLKLLNSFSFHSILPLVAIANEQQVTITKING